MAFDPGNQEANAEAVAHNYTVIPARGLTPGQRKNLYRSGTLLTTSEAFPAAGKGAYSTDPDAPPVPVIPENEWTPGMTKIHEYTVQLGKLLLEQDIVVRFVKCSRSAGGNWSACFGKRHVFSSYFDYNVAVLGKKWFEGGVRQEIDELIIHELGHFHESNHLSANYHHALCQLGARLKAEVLKNPKWFSQF